MDLGHMLRFRHAKNIHSDTLRKYPQGNVSSVQSPVGAGHTNGALQIPRLHSG
jgi:hypothetical protein